jgi:hypothetical protein
MVGFLPIETIGTVVRPARDGLNPAPALVLIGIEESSDKNK